VHFLDRLALTISEEHVTYIATHGDAPAWAMLTKRVTSAVGF
jgi:hypothetical protein